MKFTEEKRLAILEIFPEAKSVTYSPCAGRTYVWNREGHALLVQRGNVYNLTEKINLLKPIKTAKDLLEGFVVKFVNVNQENHFRKDVCDWATDYPISEKPSFLWVDGSGWAMSSMVCSNDDKLISYEEGCERLGIEPIKPETRQMTAEELFGKCIQDRNKNRKPASALILVGRIHSDTNEIWFEGSALSRDDDDFYEGYWLHASKIEQYKDHPTDKEWKSTEVEV